VLLSLHPQSNQGRLLQRCTRCESGLARGDREWPLNDGQTPNPNVVCVALGTRYSRVEGNRRASRNGRVSDPHPEESLTSRFATFAVGGSGSSALGVLLCYHAGASLAVRLAAQRLLPAAVVPGRIAFLAALPLTATGKVCPRWFSRRGWSKGFSTSTRTHYSYRHRTNRRITKDTQVVRLSFFIF
jgi:hypothetical protein